MHGIDGRRAETPDASLSPGVSGVGIRPIAEELKHRVEPRPAGRQGVYEELHRMRPANLRYATFRAEDGVTFFMWRPSILPTEGVRRLIPRRFSHFKRTS